MKIVSVGAIPVKVPQARVHKTFLEMKDSSEYVLVEVHTDEGITGLGEVSTVPTWCEPQKTSINLIKKVLQKAIVGENPLNIGRVLIRMDTVIKGFEFSKAGIEMALLDIAGKYLDTPAYNLLGGCYREKIPIGASIGIFEVDETVEWALKLAEQGFKTIKLKVGIDPERDIEAVKKVREALGEEIRLKIDANQGYREAKTAIRAIKRMEKYDLLFAEQPVYGWDLDGMAEVARSVNVPILADESIWEPRDVLRIIGKRAADALCVYYWKSGGILCAKKVLGTAELAGLPCIIGGMGELGVGTAAGLHLAASTKNVEHACDLGGPQLHKDDIIKNRHKYLPGDTDVEVEVPKGPGLGVELDEEKVEKYRIDKA